MPLHSLEDYIENVRQLFKKGALWSCRIYCTKCDKNIKVTPKIRDLIAELNYLEKRRCSTFIEPFNDGAICCKKPNWLYSRNIKIKQTTLSKVFSKKKFFISIMFFMEK